jgi:3-phosphoshikimate 1-carboxyvinyltransferase
MIVTVRRRGSLQGEIRVPGDKSVAHRALLFAGLARGRSEIHGFPGGADNRATRSIIESLGAHSEVSPEGLLSVTGFGANPVEPDHVLDCLNSGTTARLTMGMLAGFDLSATLTGDDSLRRRPMARVTGPLRAMGATIVGRSDGARLPLAISGGRLGNHSHTSPVASAQVKSALLLAGLTGGVSVEVREPAPSRDHTERFLRWLGYPCRSEGATATLDSSVLGHEGFRMGIPGDPSGAAFWAALSALDPAASVTLPGVCWSSGRIGFFRLLAQMGVDLHLDRVVDDGPEDIASLRVEGRVERGIKVEGDAVVAAIDELPLLALMGLFVESGVLIREAEELRTKETDRIETTAAVARALGGEVETWQDGLAVRPGKGFPEAAEVDSAGDHRIAMAATVAALAGGTELRLRGADAVAVSYPAFWETLVAHGAAEVDTE